LDKRQYEYRYFSAPGGFALVSRIERMSPDGSSEPPPARWDTGIRFGSSLTEYFAGVFSAPKGYFRVFVLVVTDDDFSQSGKPASRSEALNWMRDGRNRLSPEIAGKSAGPEVRCTALIYEFVSEGFDQTTKLLKAGRLVARAHLERTGLWSELEVR